MDDGLKTKIVRNFSLICLISFFFTFTNYVYLSAIPSILCYLAIPWMMATFLIAREKPPTDFVLLFALFVYLVLSTLFYKPHLLVEFSFYRYEGNVFISYGLLFLLFCNVRFHHRLNARHLTMYVAGIALIFLIALFFFKEKLLIGFDGFNFLFKSTSAAGGFLAIMFSFQLAMTLYARNRLNVLLTLLLAVLFIATHSRGSMLGVLIAIFVCHFHYSGNHRIYRNTCLSLLAVLTLATFLVSYYSNYLLDETDFLKTWLLDEGYSIGKINNILFRINDIWLFAIRGFLDSPMLGVGFGSFNDNYLFHRTEGYTTNGYLIGTVDAHAHHSLFHVAYETGIVGVAFFVALWFRLHRFIEENFSHEWRLALLMAFWAIVFASFTEHRLTTPAMLLPFVLFLCLAPRKDKVNSPQSNG